MPNYGHLGTFVDCEKMGLSNPSGVLGTIFSASIRMQKNTTTNSSDPYIMIIIIRIIIITIVILIKITITIIIIIRHTMSIVSEPRHW